MGGHWQKANKLGECLTFTIHSERKTYPVDSYEFINDPLSSMCCKYLAPQ